MVGIETLIEGSISCLFSIRFDEFWWHIFEQECD